MTLTFAVTNSIFGKSHTSSCRFLPDRVSTFFGKLNHQKTVKINITSKNLEDEPVMQVEKQHKRKLMLELARLDDDYQFICFDDGVLRAAISGAWSSLWTRCLDSDQGWQQQRLESTQFDGPTTEPQTAAGEQKSWRYEPRRKEIIWVRTQNQEASLDAREPRDSRAEEDSWRSCGLQR